MTKAAHSHENRGGRGKIRAAWAAVFTLIAAVPLAGLLPSTSAVIASCLALAGFIAALLFALGREQEQAARQAGQRDDAGVRRARTIDSPERAAAADTAHDGLRAFRIGAEPEPSGATDDAFAASRGLDMRERPAGAGHPDLLLPEPGDGERRGASRSRRPALAVGVIVVAAAAIALVSALGNRSGGKEATRGPTSAAPVASRPSEPGPHTPFRGSTFTAAAPHAWRLHDGTATRFGETVSFTDPGVPKLAVTVYVFRAQDTATARARAIEQRVRRHRSFERLFWGFVTLRAGLRAWRLDYTVGNLGYAIYTFTTCAARKLVIVLGQAPRATFRSLQSQLGFFASSVRPYC